MHFYNDQALVLRRIFLGEQDILVVLFTKEHGKVRAVAKGARSIKSSRGGHLDLFNHIKVGIRPGKSLDYVSEVSTLESFGQSKTELAQLNIFYYVIELLDSLFFEQEPHENVFRASVKLLGFVEQRQKNREALQTLLRDYELYLLRELGYWSQEEHNRTYPDMLNQQRQFNQNLLRDAVGREIKTAGNSMVYGYK